MRKALQAEQSKAEKLLQLASLEKRCMEKDNEINELKKTILARLDAEKEEKERTSEDHEHETDEKKKKNMTHQKNLSEILMNLNKADEADWILLHKQHTSESKKSFSLQPNLSRKTCFFSTFIFALAFCHTSCVINTFEAWKQWVLAV